LNALLDRLSQDMAGWNHWRLADALFARRSEAVTVLLATTAFSAALLLLYSAGGRRIGRNLVTLPALVAVSRSGLALQRHIPLVLALAGVPLFAIALADPVRAVSEQQISHPGHRIAILLDASASMMVPFISDEPKERSAKDTAFFTTVAAAEAFVRQRKAGQYRDLIALVEFGDEAYVVTPFTSDYDNVLLGMSLIGEWDEFMRFPDGGTAIGRAIDQGTALFKAFNFLDAAGNVMVIFSDGQDTQVAARGKSLRQVLAAAVEAKIPVFLIRTSRGQRLGEVVPDNIWQPAVEATGGRFFAAATADDVVRAIGEIDRQSRGTITIKSYAIGRPGFTPFAIGAGALWTLALLLKLTLPRFTTFP
jgi:hypothetical protein